MQESIPLDCFYMIYAIGQRIANIEFEGTGLGLTIVNEIVEKHGGSITCNSKEGEGSSFVVRLPQGQIISS